MQDEVEVKARELLANAPVTRFISHDFVPKVAAIRAIAAALCQRHVVDDAMVEAVWNALDPGDVPGLTRRKLRAALFAGYQQDNGGQQV